MNRLKTIVLFAGIFGIGLGAISLSDISATSLMIGAASQTPEPMGMLGHVEYKLLDNNGQIKQYNQGDNTVVQVGKDCVSRLVFDNATADITICPKGNNTFQYIAIGNKTAAAEPPDNSLEALEADSGCAGGDPGDDGEMARKQVTPSFTAATGGLGTVVVLDTQNSPFDFDGGNATGPIIQSGVFNLDNPKLSDGSCSSLEAEASMFAIQNLNGQTVGIAVSSGDSLSIKWTITVG